MAKTLLVFRVFLHFLMYCNAVNVSMETSLTTNANSDFISPTTAPPANDQSQSNESLTREGGVSIKFYGSGPRLQVKFISPAAGLIQSPDPSNVPSAIDSWVEIGVPQGNVVMVSVEYVKFVPYHLISSCDDHSVSLYVGVNCTDMTSTGPHTTVAGNSSSKLVWKTCKLRIPPKVLQSCDVIFVRFLTTNDRWTYQKGFRIQFSFHKDSSILEQLSDGKWNCSVPHFRDFHQHFPCDLISDCKNGEDEAECLYSSATCPWQQITAGGRCFQILPEMTGSWEEARTLCHKAGGELSTWNTPEEWNELIQILKTLELDSLYVGLRVAPYTLPPLYRHAWLWADGTIAYYADMNPVLGHGTCVVYHNINQQVFSSLCENKDLQRSVLCEMTNDCKDRVNMGRACKSTAHDDPDVAKGTVTITSISHSARSDFDDAKQTLLKISLPTQEFSSTKIGHVTCPSGHVTHDFLACDMRTSCWVEVFDSNFICAAPLTPLPPEFACTNGIGQVPYTVVCDFRTDCGDSSDEDFCIFPPCDVSSQYECGNKQCVYKDQWCDGQAQCVNEADERRCPLTNTYAPGTNIPPPAIIDFTKDGTISVRKLDNENVGSTQTHWSLDSTSSYPFRDRSSESIPSLLRNEGVPSEDRSYICPSTHFRCPGVTWYCLPVYVRCNGVYDCPGKEDEADCDSYTCPGFYLCRASKICLHADHVCDNIFQCPMNDDEILCDVICPPNCTCYGMSFFCSTSFHVSSYSELRFLDADGTGMGLSDVSSNGLLIYLSLAECQLSELNVPFLPNLQTLDLSDNDIHVLKVKDIENVPNVRFLSLAGNPVTSFFQSTTDAYKPFYFLTALDISRIYFQTFDTNNIKLFPNLKFLNVSGSGINALSMEGFKPFRRLRVLDLRGCPMLEFPEDIFQGLKVLKEVHAENYKLCCSEILPRSGKMSEQHSLVMCSAPSDEISSCEALLRSDLYRVILSIFSFLALVGNLGSFLYRVFVSRKASQSSFGVFVTHLSVSDFLMGLYLAIIGVADRIYQGTYLWNDVIWKSSAVCKMAGFLSLLSSEVSAFIICLVTLDRFLVLRFPFSRLRFRKWSAHVTCAVAWVTGMIIAAIPLLPVTSYWQFYSQTGICLPLPVTRKTFPGQTYSFAIMIVLNFFLFLLIAVGQASIYWSIKSNSISTFDKFRATDQQKTCRSHDKARGPRGSRASSRDLTRSQDSSHGQTQSHDSSRDLPRSNDSSRDLTIARRLLTVVMSDFLCWFPIGLLGMLAATGTEISGEVNVVMAVVVLPFNSALNPFLYTLNGVLERRDREREERLLKRLKALSQARTTETSLGK